MVDAGVLDDDLIVTHVGHLSQRLGRWNRLDFSFRALLRAERDETYMSVIAGELTPEDAVPLVARGDAAGSADAVRYARVGDLRKAGFTVTPKPSKGFPQHTAVEADGEWTLQVAVSFGSCFSSYTPGPSYD